ncbi:MAG TPA: amino acid adenylation domain-containing protein [Terriglobales bacterium]|nr:amino acid adenylation domain-containing protein [Terriglobales bacterium]
MAATSPVPKSQSGPKSRRDLLEYQHKHFQKLLIHVWNRSAFYRDYYSSHGVAQKELADISVADLPLLPKKTLIDNFNRAVTDPWLKKKEIEEWFETHRDPSEKFCKDMVVIHGSSTSGDIGIFAYDRRAWTFADATVAGRLPLPENYPNGRTKIAFYVAANGHFGTVSMASSMPKNVYDVLILSLLNSSEQTIEELNRFQPHRLMSYASSAAALAEHALNGRLKIHPQRVFVGGDKLTESMKTKIRDAWHVPIYDLFAASESKYIAIKTPERDQMLVMDDLNLVEVLNEKNQAVGAEQEGRIVLTNLYNYTLPILRYELGDYVMRGTDLPDVPFTSLRDIRGRVNDALPVALAGGQIDSIHPIVLTTFYLPMIEKFQFISVSPELIRIDYVARQNMDTTVRREFERMLQAKGAVRTRIVVRRVASIANDSTTGKLRLVKFETQQIDRYLLVKSEEAPVSARGQIHIEHDFSFVPFPRTDIEQSIPVRFEQQVKRYPTRVAVKSGDVVLSYTDLNRAANRLAHAIIARLDAKEVTVALLLPQGVQAAIAILGILKSGRCYVPLDTGYPFDRLAGILADAQVTLLLIDNETMPAAVKIAGDSVEILNLEALDEHWPAENPNLPISPDFLAYLFYTSGSTGEPKGVVQNHRNVLYQIMTYTNGLRLNPEDRIGQLHSHAFSASRLDIFGALLNGAALFPLSSAQGMSYLARRLMDEKITVFHWIPTAFRYFAETLGKSEEFPNLRLIVLGSEPLGSRDFDFYRTHFSSSCVLVNRFGATETGNVCWYFMDKHTSVPVGPVPVGYAIDEDTEVLLLDESGREVEKNQMGEIVVRSRYLTPGYWHRRDLVREAFSPLPGALEKRIYRTGDLGQMMDDGCLVHLGRKDFQAKIRGYRVDVGEVERALLDHAAVAAAVVITRLDHQGNTYLVAYYVVGNAPPPASGALRNFLEARLPSYMVPAAFVRLETLPLTPSGKLNRSALPDPHHEKSQSDAPAAAPRTEVEASLVEIWSNVLGLATVGVHDNFFDLGGHSLAAMMIMARVAQAFGIDLSLRVFFESPTITHMAAMISSPTLQGIAEADLVTALSTVESLSDAEVRELLEEKDRK